MKHGLEMQQQNVSKLLWKFSLPAIVGMLVNSIYNIVDRIFVGQGVGSIGIAATTVAFPLMLIFMGFSILVGIGATALISIRLGQRNMEEAEKVAGNGATMLVILPLILTAVYLLFTEPILIFFGASNEVLPYARDFTHIIVLGSVFGSISMGMNNFIRADGSPRVAMMTQILGAVINVILNYFFIFKLGLGIKGSALATVSSQFISALWVLSYFLTGRSNIELKLTNLKLQLPILLSILSIGFAPFAMQIASSVQQIILNKTLMIYGGDLALSAVGIIMSIFTILFMPIVGLSQGAQPIIGFNYGAKEYTRVRETLKKAVIAGTSFALIGTFVVHLWPNQIIGLFSKDDVALTAMTSHAMLIYFTMLPVLGFQIICSNYFQAVGKPIQSTILALSRQVILFIPLLLILPHFWGIDGVWRAAPISDGIAVLLTGTLIFFEMKALRKSEQSLTILKEQPES